jgi:hypothetical protein
MDTVDPIVCMYSRLELTHEVREQAPCFDGRPRQQNGVMGELPVQRLQRRTAFNPSLGNWNHTCIWQNVGSLVIAGRRMDDKLIHKVGFNF